MENQNQQNYGNINQNLGDEDISCPQQLPMEQGEYGQDGQDQMPPIYAEKIESVKETTEHQVKYFEPIEISSEEDVAKYLQSGQLMQTIAPKINALKKETQASSDPSVHTEVQFELTQNDAIYNNPEGGNEDNQGQKQSQNNNLNATSPYMNNKYALGQQGNNDMSKTQQFSQMGPNGIKYSSVLPPKFAQTKVITVDQYGNRQVENNGDDEADGAIQNEENQNQDEIQRQQYEYQLEQQRLEQEQLELQKQQRELEEQQKIEEQKYKEMQLQQQQQELDQQRLQQQQLEQQRLSQQQQLLLQQQRMQQQQQQQQLGQQRIPQQQLEQQRLQLLQQQQLEQQRIQQIQQQQQTNNNQNIYPYSRAYSGQNLDAYKQFQSSTTTQKIQNNIQIHGQASKSPNRNSIRNNNIQQKDPLVEKVYKISGTLRPRRKMRAPNEQNLQNQQNIRNLQNPQNLQTLQNQQNLRNLQTQQNLQTLQNQQNLRNLQTQQNIRNLQNQQNIRNLQNQQNMRNLQTQQNIRNLQNTQRLNLQNLEMQKAAQIAVLKIQQKWRRHFIKKRFEQIKPKLKFESEEFLNKQYELCDKNGPAASDDDFCLDGWKKFYPPNDPFFNFRKGFVLQYGIKIRHANDPNKVSVYEGDINIRNERHGFGRLTTTKSVFLGEWRNDQFTGWGRETRRSGKVLEGKYIDGVVMGKGILKNNKGNTYIGDFYNSKRHGKGVLDTHKVHYEGEFKNDKLCGKGRIVFKTEGHYYEGEFSENEINGFGTFKWKNGDSYTGQMLNGKMHGNGRYRYNNGQIYEGTYVNGVKAGKNKANVNNIQNNMVNKNKDPKGLNISGVTTKTINNKFGGGK